ncbi:MAG: 2OG-Fe(II) oxygenase [Deltaproteobacteria bacterium]|nr:2OG-Fe(II) oxygenase [Deltaproteobacteria bacterium]
MEDALTAVIDSLRTRAFAVVDQLVPEGVLQGLCEDIRHAAAAHFRPAGVGRGGQFTVAPDVRSDQLLWMDPQALTEAQAGLLARLDELRVALNRAFFISLRRFEGHLTVYSPGAHYQKHVDQFTNHSHRLISCVIYLNPTWDPSWGGQLRLFDPASPSRVLLDVEPTWGRTVLFWSDAVPHEVLTTHAPRWSATGWFRDDDF